MDAMLPYLRDESADKERGPRMRNVAEYLEESNGQLQECAVSVWEYVTDAWNDIIVNDALQLELRMFFEVWNGLKEKVAEFKDAFHGNEVRSFALFDDEWTAQRYQLLVHTADGKFARLLSLMRMESVAGMSESNPIHGIARLFRRYFVGVGDSELADFLRTGKPFGKPAKWLGDRDEAVIMARAFGLTARDMNGTFIIPGRKTAHRNLNLSGDAPSYDDSRYPIWSSIETARKMMACKK
ncbi:MAG: hypothetical protein MJZ06_07170 [Bacteroidaceae bacterium]|nr:hypothetical protein [Bacteroidaceae bacterium]